jgi:hypothetical protein
VVSHTPSAQRANEKSQPPGISGTKLGEGATRKATSTCLRQASAPLGTVWFSQNMHLVHVSESEMWNFMVNELIINEWSNNGAARPSVCQFPPNPCRRTVRAVTDECSRRGVAVRAPRTAELRYSPQPCLHGRLRSASCTPLTELPCRLKFPPYRRPRARSDPLTDRSS